VLSCQAPPRAVRTPRSFNAAAMARNVVAPSGGAGVIAAPAPAAYPAALVVALAPQWRQDCLNNRPPTQATAISEMGHLQTHAMQHPAHAAARDRPIKSKNPANRSSREP
jgi:hypothetical protein